MRIKIIILVSVVVAITAYCCKQTPNTSITHNNDERISLIDSLSDIYDNDTTIVYWEMQNDTLHLYTQEDSIRDELERIKYINSVEPFTPDYE